jgi:hypothetical protein
MTGRGVFLLIRLRLAGRLILELACCGASSEGWADLAAVLLSERRA